jgi:segregation and condensation protein B
MNQPLPSEEFQLDDEIAIVETPEDARVQLAIADQKRAVEAVLFAAPTAMAPGAIAAQLKLTADEVESLLLELQADYRLHGIQLQQNAGHWHFQTAADLAPHLTFVKTRPIKLSRAAMESLAVIAYHQPLTRTEIENIRGVAIHKGTLDLLLETGWIKPGKRREVPGRPLTWVTTDAFLEHFGLATLKELPGVAELKAAGLLDRRPAIALVPDPDDAPEPQDQADAEDLSDFLPENSASESQ